MDRWKRIRAVGIATIVVSSAALTYGLTTTSKSPDLNVCPERISLDPADWSRDAIGADAAVRAAAIERLRATGPAGLEAFTRVHIHALRKFYDSPACGCAGDSPERRLADAYDRIAGQRDAWYSNLYWYTDLDEAKRAAEREGKPIISLRMLGKLTDELSCANSRFFRTTLYADWDLARYMRNNFVLHWHSVRPVPKITIDYGDGRRLERTITGNSAHYLLDRRGRVIDVLPGLYSPQAFTRELHRALIVAGSLDSMRPDQHNGVLTAYHIESMQRLVRELNERNSSSETQGPGTQNDSDDETTVANAAPTPKMSFETPAVRAVTSAALPDLPAQTVGMSAPGVFSSDLDIPFNKSTLERVAVRAVTPNALPDIPARNSPKSAGRRSAPAQTAAPTVGPYVVGSSPAFAAMPTDAPLTVAELQRLAVRFEAEVRLHPNAVRLIEAKLDAIPAEYLPGPRKAIRSTAMANLRRGIAFETARNEFDFRRRVHSWLAMWHTSDLDRLDDKVYAELFLMPRTDAWAGLLSIESFSAIDGSGIVVEK